jgi:hypothetical protein
MLRMLVVSISCRISETFNYEDEDEDEDDTPPG